MKRTIVTIAFLGLAAALAASTSGATGKAAAYCKKKGGRVQVRYPVFGTNDPSTEIRLGGSVAFCKFTAKDGSRIYASLATLYSTRPTLAALAYLTKPPVGEVSSGANPASVYCSKLGGSDSFGGVSAAGGGWVSKTDKDDPVLEACVFPDQSIIDSWGLTYHANGIVRGADLTTILRYRPTNPPNVFG